MTKSPRIVLFVLALVAAWPALLAAQAGAERAGEVTALLPVAHLQRGSAAPGDLRLHDPLFWRDWVETEARARARLGLLDGSILNVGSEVRLQVVRHDQASEQTELELKFGKVRAVVRKLGRPEGRFEVRTEMAVVGVLGTHVYVDSAAALVTVINFDGQVRVAHGDPGVGGDVRLEPLELAEVERGLPPRKRWATVAELLRALEDTLPGPAAGLHPQQARIGSCASASTDEALVDTDGDGLLARFPFLEVTARGCAVPGFTPVRVCVPQTAQPGAYEWAAAATGGEPRWGAFLVQPPLPLQDARLLYSPELPPGATHYARLVGRDDQPLAGVPVRIRSGGQEQTVTTDENGGFTIQAPEKGSLELELGGQTASVGAGPLAEAPKPWKATVNVVEQFEPESEVPEFREPGSLVTVPGEVSRARLGTRDLPVLRTVTRAGRTVSSVALPPQPPDAPAPLELEDPSGNRRTHPLLVYEVLSGRLDQRDLISGNVTQGEFLVCVGSVGEKRRKVRAHILAIGPVRFRGPGAKGKKFERTFAVEPSGLLRIPFQIQAEKTGSPAAIPAVLTLRLEPG